MTTEERNKAWDKVKVHLLFEGAVFITTVGFNLKFNWSTRVPTAGTDGSSILFNPDYFDSLTNEERLFVYAHEIWHCCFMHMIRGKNKDKEKWNIAADNVINLMLIAAGYKMPKGGLADKAYTGMSTDQVYALLPDTPPPFDYPFDLLEPSDEGEEDAKQKIKIKLEDLIIEATTASQLQEEDPGNIPDEIAVSIQELINPVLPWETLLLRFVEDNTKNDYSWRKPNRRLLSTAYLPTLYSKSITNITVCIDISRSVSDEQFTAFLTEIDYIRECFLIETMPIISFDTRIKNIDILKEGDSVADLTLVGRGGTDLVPVFNYLKENPANIIIIFSDLEVNIPKKEFEGNLLYVCIDNPSRTVEEGTLIHYSI